jgi:hypothetical protein
VDSDSVCATTRVEQKTAKPVITMFFFIAVYHISGNHFLKRIRS